MTQVLIRLTHLKSNKPTYININNITSVRENDEGKTLILTGDSGQYVKESVDTVLSDLKHYGFEVI